MIDLPEPFADHLEDNLNESENYKAAIHMDSLSKSERELDDLSRKEIVELFKRTASNYKDAVYEIEMLKVILYYLDEDADINIEFADFNDDTHSGAGTDSSDSSSSSNDTSGSAGD